MMYKTFNVKMYDTQLPVADDRLGTSTGQDSGETEKNEDSRLVSVWTSVTEKA